MLKLRKPWTRQPQGTAVSVDWSNPLTRGLRLAVIGGSPQNIVTGQMPAGINRLSSGVASEGQVWTGDAPSGTINSRGIVFPFDVSGALTVHTIVLRSASVNDADSSRIATVIGNLDNGQANFWHLNLGNGFGAAGDDNKPRFSLSAAGVGTIYADGIALSGNNPATTALTNGQWYRMSAAKPAGATDTSGTNRISIGGQRSSGGAYYGLNGSIALVLLWERELSAVEISQLTRREYELFQPRSIRVPVSVGGGSVTGTSATTNANDTSTASGTTTVVGTSATTNANDTATASGSVGGAVTGTSATTNANDTSLASGTTTVTGSVAYSNANDSAAASGWAGSVSGTAAVTNADDTAQASGTAEGGATDTHDGFWSREWAKLRKREEKKPTIAEVVEIVKESPQVMEVVRAEVVRKYPQVDYAEVRQNLALQRFIAKQLIEAAQEEDDIETLLLMA